MSPIRNILAATDFSAPARNAVHRAAALARDLGADLYILHVLGPGTLADLVRVLGPGAAAAHDRVRREAQEQAAGIADELRGAYGVEARVRLMEGSPLRQIEACADEIDADLIVLGAQGQTVVRRLLLGTTAERMLRKTVRPTLIVRRPAAGAYERLLAPADFSDWSLPALRLAAAVAPGAETVVLHAYRLPFEDKLRFAGVDEESIERHHDDAEREAMLEAQRLVFNSGINPDRVRILIRRGDAAPIILETEESERSDLVVIGKHGRGALEELLLGGVAKHVVALSEADVLIAGRR